jgi:hypothetical protein
MSSFTSELIVEPLDDGKSWVLKRPFTYHIGSKYSRTFISVPKNFITDFASVPKILTLFLPAWAKFQKSAVLHDAIYQGKVKWSWNIVEFSRKDADNIFHEAMLIEFRNHKSGRFISKIEYLAVRWFAKFAWR